MLTRPSIWLTAVLSLIFAGYSLWTETFDLRVFFALLALWVALYQAERANRVLATITDCDQHWATSIKENNRQMFSKLIIVVRNEGLTLHNPELVIEYLKSPIYGGRRSFHLVSEGAKDGKLEKGMYARFYLKSYQIIHGADILADLTNGYKQKAYLHLYSQGYLAHSWRVGSLLERIKMKWNGLASQVNWQTRKPITLPEGNVVIKETTILPRFQVLEPHIVRFAQSLIEKKEGESPAVENPPRGLRYVAFGVLVLLLWWLLR